MTGKNSLLDKKQTAAGQLLTETEREYESFVTCSAQAYFMQSIMWAQVKSNWRCHAIVSKDAAGKVQGAMLLLIRKSAGVSMVYSPRGPVCDIMNRAVLTDLLKQAFAVCRAENACQLKIDPVILKEDAIRIQELRSFGFSFTPDKADFTTVQPRGNYVLTGLSQKTEEQVLMCFKQKTRYNIKVAKKHGVACEFGKSDRLLDDFYRLLIITGRRDGFQIRDKSYYRKMLDCFGENARLYVCYYEKNAVSAAFCIQFANRTYYLFGASDNEYRNVMPNYLMQWEMIRWAIANKTDIYDFMGVPTGEAEDAAMRGVLRFKQGFNGEMQVYAGEFDYNFHPVVIRGIAAIKQLYKMKARILGRFRK